MSTVEGTQEYLLKYNIKPSLQRMAIMDYLMAHRVHPTADEIYNALYPTMPTLSKTTIYNTMKLFTEQGAVKALVIDEKTCDSILTRRVTLISCAWDVVACMIFRLKIRMRYN